MGFHFECVTFNSFGILLRGFCALLTLTFIWYSLFLCFALFLIRSLFWLSLAASLYFLLLVFLTRSYYSFRLVFWLPFYYFRIFFSLSVLYQCISLFLFSIMSLTPIETKLIIFLQPFGFLALLFSFDCFVVLPESVISQSLFVEACHIFSHCLL